MSLGTLYPILHGLEKKGICALPSDDSGARLDGCTGLRRVADAHSKGAKEKVYETSALRAH